MLSGADVVSDLGLSLSYEDAAFAYKYAAPSGKGQQVVDRVTELLETIKPSASQNDSVFPSTRNRILATPVLVNTPLWWSKRCKSNHDTV